MNRMNINDSVSAKKSSQSSSANEPVHSKWSFNRELNISAVVQIVLLASLIIGSYLNLQRQMDMMSSDVARLLECQKRISDRIELLSEKTIEYQYRLSSLEQRVSQSIGKQ